MTTFFDFTPSRQTPFQFSPTLDGTIYTVVVTWNFFGQRYYVNCYSLNGVLVFSLPLIGSAIGINLAQLTWNSGTVTAIAEAQHGYTVGTEVELTISGAVPDVYNGIIRALIVDDTTFTYPLPGNDPGPASQYGIAAYNINLAEGYFESTLVFRQQNQQFEVSP